MNHKIVRLCCIVIITFSLFFIFEKQIHNTTYNIALSFIDVDYDKNLNYLTINEFHRHIINVYEYNKTKDCKYWTKYWSIYLKSNNYNITYIAVNKHIFLTAQKNGYNYILDQTTLSIN